MASAELTIQERREAKIRQLQRRGKSEKWIANFMRNWHFNYSTKTSRKRKENDS